MTSREFDASIRAGYMFLNECKFVRNFRPFKSLVATVEFRELVLRPAPSYRDIFMCGLRNSDYNYLLLDYSFFQFTFYSKIHYRFAFYPNPFVVPGGYFDTLDRRLADGEITFEEYSENVSAQPYELSKPPIRFELDRQAYVQLLHPAAHFHIGNHAENRWPTCRCLTPRSFCLLIVKMYYGDRWSSGIDSTPGDSFRNRFDRYFNKEKLSCDLLEPAFFHENERGQIHFA